MLLTLQLHVEGAWQDAATLEIEDAARGIASATTLAYDDRYYFAHGATDHARGHAAIDRRALSVCHPLDLASVSFRSWPPFLLDLLPQGHARRRLAEQLGYDAEDDALALPLLLAGAGSPIGNIRVKEAWEAEQVRLQRHHIEGVTTEEIFERGPRFRELAEVFALVASGSSGVQGEWPKILLTCATDGLWYPDSVVEDARAVEHVIVKMSRARFAEDRVILAAEAPYLEVARELGLRVGRPLTHRGDTLLIPRFDREVVGGQVRRSGQESLVAATGVAAFAYQCTHERYIQTLHRCCTDPTPEIVEYVLRDVVSRAMGDTDNHGRNTALAKGAHGGVGLAPRFDFAPMILDPGMIAPSTTWACVRGKPGGLDYSRICEAIGVATGDPATAAAVRAALAGKAELVARLPVIARARGVADEVVERAVRFSGEVARGLAALGGLG